MRGYSKIDIVLIVKEKANLYGFAFLYADKTKTATKGGWLTRYCNICYTQNVNNDVKQVVPPNIREVMTWSLIPICSSSASWSVPLSVCVFLIESNNRPWIGAAFPQVIQLTGTTALLQRAIVVDTIITQCPGFVKRQSRGTVIQLSADKVYNTFPKSVKQVLKWRLRVMNGKPYKARR